MKKSKFVIIAVFCAVCFSFTGCMFDTPTPATEISQSTFSSQLATFGVSLQTHQTSMLDEINNISSVGSEEYASLVQKIPQENIYTVNSSKKTTYFYTDINSGDTLSNYMAISTADQTPEIYLYNGNYRYPTGKCSNVVAIHAKNKSNLTIKNCVFENMSGISLYNCTDVTITNCYFKGAENGIYLAKCTNIDIVNCTFEMNSTGLTDYYQGVYLGDGNSYVTTTNCFFKADENIKKPFRIGSKSTEQSPSQNITFDGCVSVGKFRSGFQNIDGEAVLKNCTFVFSEYASSYNSAIIIDDKSDKTYTTLKNCNFYLTYRKKLSSSATTMFENCTYNLFES